ncbi:TPA: hypothetical protein EYN98_32555 [Candidatus Poribacteria bacterium]|nr:hypothetical protein [Candidatus Poribacteria bacterium]HIB91063.1 hypothetical protein [Candidatus Poribacteria bacterium]HIB99946.1 hypothetical protein [Candidatus Poribacteria bacterium]HIN31117.1 hypothetical protein [Candidatus Poribacteria bacterium]HIO09275.1 hypothetical protein [Candidatus Poribacteria bacterium]
MNFSYQHFQDIRKQGKMCRNIVIYLALLLSVTHVDAILPGLSIDRVEGNSGTVAIYYTATDPAEKTLSPINYEYSINNGVRWIKVDKDAISASPSEGSNSSAVFWDTRSQIGKQPVNSILFRMRVYDPEIISDWQTVSPMPTSRHGLATVVIGNKLYVIGGFNGRRQVATLELYNPATDTWEKAASMDQARQYLSAEVVNGKIYAIGGYGRTSYLSTTEAYDPVTDTWQTMAPMPTSRHVFATAVVGDLIYAIGGHNGRSLATVEVYDTKTNNWKKSASIPTPRYGLVAVAVGHKIYTFGGQDQKPLSSFEIFDIAENQWSAGPNMPTARYAFAAAIDDELLKIYLVGGTGGGDKVEVYNINNGKWEILAMINQTRSHLGAGIITNMNQLYAVGGVSDQTLSIVEALPLVRYSKFAVSPAFPVYNHIQTEITSPTAGSYNQGIISIQGTANTEKLQGWILDIAPSANPTEGYLLINSGTSSVLGDELAEFDTLGQPDSTHTIRLRVTDVMAKTAETSVIVKIDNSILPKPELKISTNEGVDGFTRSNVSIFVTGKAYPRNLIARAEVIGGEEIANVTDLIDIDKSGVISGEIPGVNVGQITNLSVRIVVKSRSGNQAESVSNLLMIDNHPPEIAILSPANGANFNTDSIQVVGTASDRLSGLIKVEIDVGSGWEKVETNKSNWVYQLTIPPEIQQLVVRARAVDKAENITITAPIYVSNLTSRPRVNILHPTEGTNLLGKIPVKGTIEGDNLSWVLEYAPGQHAQEGFEEIDRGTEAKGHDQQIATWDVSSLPDGQYTLRLTVTNTLTTITVTRHNLIRSP